MASITGGGKNAEPLPITDNGGSLTVDGPLTDAQLRATAIPVSIPGSVPVNDNDGSLTVDGPITDAQLRATAVPVSGPVTDAQLRAAAVPVSAASLPLPTGAATAAKQDDALAMKAKPAVADILSGGRTTSGTVITVPANKVWMGWLHLSMSARSSGVLSTILTWTPGTTGTPTYSPLTVSTAIDAAEVGESIKTETVSSSVWCVLYAGTTAGTIALTGAGSTAHGSANGYVVDA